MLKRLCLLTLMLILPVSAGAWPDKPFTNLCGWAPGGGADLQGRIIEKAWAEEFGKPLSFVYKSGANGAIAATELAHSRPDGHTIAPFSLPHLFTNLLTGKGQYSLDSFTILGQVAFDSAYLAVSADSPVKTFDDFLALASEKKINVGSIDLYGNTHLAALSLLERNVPYAIVCFGSGPKTISALLGHQVDAMFGMTGSVMGSLGKMRLLAIAAPERLKDFPDVPTFRELGYNIVQIQSRIFMVSSKVSEERKARLIEGLGRIMARSDVQEAFRKNAFVPEFVPGDVITRRFEAQLPEIERLTRFGMSLSQ